MFDARRVLGRRSFARHVRLPDSVSSVEGLSAAASGLVRAINVVVAGFGHDAPSWC